MPRALKVCSRPTCPNLTRSGRCPACASAAEQARGTSTQRGYGVQHRDRFRAGVLAKHPRCQHPGCVEPSTVADHWPLSRRELVALGLDPNDPANGRGLCGPHHGVETARNQPGGFAAQTGG